MTELTIYGASDDLLEIRGDMKKEAYPPNDYKLLLSDGTLLHLKMDWDWKINVETLGEGTTYEKYSQDSEKEEEITGRKDSSDVIKLHTETPVEKLFIIDDVREVIEK